jgi:glycosyltransferase involved in cell wall biosynthesis
MDIAAELEEAILSDQNSAAIAINLKESISSKTHGMWLRFERYSPNFFKRAVAIFRREFLSEGQHYFNVLMEPNWRKCFPHVLCPGRKSVYLFDAWPVHHEMISRFVQTHHLRHVFVSSSQCVSMLKEMSGSNVFSWVPEGVDSRKYRYSEYESKDIDVLELGRKYDVYHDHVVNALEDDGRVHLYEKTKGKLIFPTEENLIDGLARTKISICVPSNITHPDRAGDVETMTVRYLQSMASKCLIVGHAPKEMVELFGYNPVVEIDMDEPVGQIREILENFSDYIPLIEKNYAETIANHTWNKRWEQMVKIIQED